MSKEHASRLADCVCERAMHEPKTVQREVGEGGPMTGSFCCPVRERVKGEYFVSPKAQLTSGHVGTDSTKCWRVSYGYSL